MDLTGTGNAESPGGTFTSRGISSYLFRRTHLKNPHVDSPPAPVSATMALVALVSIELFANDRFENIVTYCSFFLSFFQYIHAHTYAHSSLNDEIVELTWMRKYRDGPSERGERKFVA